MKKIGILGSGAVGKALAQGLAELDYHVTIGTGNPDKLSEWLREIGKPIKISTFEETAQFGELLILAIKGAVAGEVLQKIDEAYLNKKVIIDATNPIDDQAGGPEDGVLKFFTKANTSLLED